MHICNGTVKLKTTETAKWNLKYTFTGLISDICKLFSKVPVTFIDPSVAKVFLVISFSALEAWFVCMN